MDGQGCPLFNGIGKFTQKLMSKVHNKKDDNGKNLCPICGCRSPKGNLCQPCFMRSFTPIAYSRNIKVVEQNEYFYGTGKKKRWIRKPFATSTQSNKYAEDQIGKGIMNFGVSATTRSSTLENSVGDVEMIREDGGSHDDLSVFHGKTINELFQPAVNDVESHVSKNVDGSSEDNQSDFVQVELNDDNDDADEPQDLLEPLPKLVPDFWEPSEDESTHKLSERLKVLTNYVVKEAQRPFKEIFGEPKSDSGVTSLKGKHNTTDEEHQSVDSAESIRSTEVQKKLWKQTQTDLESHLKTGTDPGSHDCTRLNKQLKQKATLELLKMAFKTNMFLKSLFYYFKKVVESEGSASESLPENQEIFRNDGLAADGKFSVDSFFFPNKRRIDLRGSNRNCDKEVRSCNSDDVQSSGESDNIETGTDRSSSAEDSRSGVEVLSKSHATLAMLMKGKRDWTKFVKEDVQKDLQVGAEENCHVTGYDSRQQYLSRLLKGRLDKFGQQEIDCNMETSSGVKVLERGSYSERNCYQPKIKKKFHSEHSSLIVMERCDEQMDNSGCASGTVVCDDVSCKTDYRNDAENADNVQQNSAISSLVDVSEEFNLPSERSGHSQKSLLDLVFGLNRSCVKPSLLPLPDCQQDLITLSTPESSTERFSPPNKRKDAISQTTLSSKHLEQEMNLLHKAFLDQLAHFSVQLVDSYKTFGHSWQTSFLSELVEHFRSACNIISALTGGSQSVGVTSLERLDELQNISNNISLCLAKLRSHPHSFTGDCADHDISTLLSSPPGQDTPSFANTWV